MASTTMDATVRFALRLYCDGAVKAPPADFWSNKLWNAPHVGRFRDEAEALRATEHMHVLFAGDSTTRDTFYQFVNALGSPVFARFVKVPGRITYPEATHGRDRWGACLGSFRKSHVCVRNVTLSSGSTVAFEFLTRASSDPELSVLRGWKGNLSHAFVQCPIYEWVNPNAYNHNASLQERRRLANRDAPAMIGRACRTYMDALRERWPHVQLYLLGPTPPPSWLNRSVPISKIFDSIHRYLNISCQSPPSFGRIFPVDRFSIVQHRRVDAIHPYMYAQHAIVRLILTLLRTRNGESI